MTATNFAATLGISLKELEGMAIALAEANDPLIIGAAVSDPAVFLALVGLVNPPIEYLIPTARAVASAIWTLARVHPNPPQDPRTVITKDKGFTDMAAAIFRGEDVTARLRLAGDKRGLRVEIRICLGGPDITLGCMSVTQPLHTFDVSVSSEQIRAVGACFDQTPPPAIPTLH